MKRGRKIKEAPPKPKQGTPREKPPGQWKLRVTRKMRKSAQKFLSAVLKIEPVEECEFPEPAITTLTVRLQFSSPLQGSRAEELIQMIGAASETNIESDTSRARELNVRLKSLETRVMTKQSAAAEVSEKLKWAELFERIIEALDSLYNLGEPPYRNHESTSVDRPLDFRSIWRERMRYTVRLSEFERVGRVLRAESERIGAKKPEPRHAPDPVHSLQNESAGRGVEISVPEFLGRPLSNWVSEVGGSASHTKFFSKDARWQDLAATYCELYSNSGLLDYAPVGIEGGPENPFWDAAREVLSQAQRHLLDFLKAACEVDSPPAGVEPVPKAKGHRVKKEKAKPAVSTNEKPARKMVCVQRTGAEGIALEVQVDGVEVGEEAPTTKKVLMAACILHLRSGNYDWWETKDLMALALTADELKNQAKARAKDLGNWQGALLASSHRLNLEKRQAGRWFRLSGIEFKTSLKEPEIQSELQRFSEINPIQRRARKK